VLVNEPVVSEDADLDDELKAALRDSLQEWNQHEAKKVRYSNIYI
jgi:hypothetical protein